MYVKKILTKLEDKHMHVHKLSFNFSQFVSDIVAADIFALLQDF